MAIILFAIIVDIMATIYALASGVSPWLAIPLGVVGLVVFPVVIFMLQLMVGLVRQGQKVGSRDFGS